MLIPVPSNSCIKPCPVGTKSQIPSPPAALDEPPPPRSPGAVHEQGLLLCRCSRPFLECWIHSCQHRETSAISRAWGTGLEQPQGPEVSSGPREITECQNGLAWKGPSSSSHWNETGIPAIPHSLPMGRDTFHYCRVLVWWKFLTQHLSGSDSQIQHHKPWQHPLSSICCKVPSLKLTLQ